MADDRPIWCSNFLYNSRTFRNLRYQFPDEERHSYMRSRHLEGQPLTEGDMPDEIFCVLGTKGDKLPDIFLITGRLLLVSERFKSLLKEFELGATKFFRVNVLEGDRETPVNSGPFYLMNYTEFREVAVPEQISNARKVGRRFSVTDLKAAPVVVRPERLDGLDFALDSKVYNFAFFSDGLVKAIKAEKIKPLSFVRCVVADG